MAKQKYTNEELLNILKAKAEELGRAPFGYELTQRVTIIKRFGRWNKALELAGVSIKSKEKYTTEELLDVLKAKAKELGRTPCHSEFPHATTISKRFGNWNKAREAAGLSIKRRDEYTKEELLDIIKAKAEELGRAPFGYEISQRKAIVKNFDSWDNAIEAAGLYINRQNYTDEQLIEIMKEKAKELGRKPRSKEISQIVTITKRFGSWDKALEAAGICTSRKKYTDEAAS